LTTRSGRWPGTLVVLVPDANRRNREGFFQNCFSDELGKFKLGGIPPGEYILFAWSSSNGTSYRNPDWLTQYETRGSVVRVSEGTHLTVQLRTIKPTDSSQ